MQNLQEAGARAEELSLLLKKYQDSYYKTGKADVSDAEYDALFDELVALENRYPFLKKEDSPTQRVGSDLSQDFPEVEHTIPVLSLDKAYSAEEVLSFMNKLAAGNPAAGMVLEEKIDGFSIVLYYEKGILKKAVTRGNGHIGNDVTANVRTIKTVPLSLSKPVDITVRGEIYLGRDDFEKINNTLEEEYANPRNLAAGTIRRKESRETARVPLKIFVYEGFWKDAVFSDHICILKELKDLGFTVDGNLSFFCKTKEEARQRLNAAGLDGFCGSFEDLAFDIKQRTQMRKNLPYDIDGLVVKVNEIAYREDLGYTEHHPRWAIAYKFDAPQAKATVLDIDFQVGRTGRITPMARISDTFLAGSTIKNITLHNQDYVDSLELAIGDVVAISKRGDVIPAVESVLEKNNLGNTTYKIPSECSCCHSPIVKVGSHHFCSNKNCPDRVKGQLTFFCEKKQMDIEGLGPQTIEDLYNTGNVRSISDIFNFDYTQLLSVEGYKDKKLTQIMNSVKDAKNRPFAKVLQGMGIPEFGKKAIECMIGAGFTDMDKFLALTKEDEEKLSQINLIGPVTAHIIVQAFNDPETVALVEELKKCGLKMKAETEENNTEQIFAGQSWCITGTFEKFKPRDKAMEEIKKRGGTEVTSVSSKTYALLAGENAGSKLDKARSLGVRIVTEKEFLELLG